MMVVMAVVTTVMTEPLLRVFYPDRLLQRDVAEAARAALEADGLPGRRRRRRRRGRGRPRRGRRRARRAPRRRPPRRARHHPLHAVPARHRSWARALGLGRQLDEMAESLRELHDLAACAEAPGRQGVGPQPVLRRPCQRPPRPARDDRRRRRARGRPPRRGVSSSGSSPATPAATSGVVHLGAGRPRWRPTCRRRSPAAPTARRSPSSRPAIAIADGVPVQLVDDHGPVGPAAGLRAAAARPDRRRRSSPTPGAEGLEHHLVGGSGPGTSTSATVRGRWCCSRDDHAAGAEAVAAAGRIGGRGAGQGGLRRHPAGAVRRAPSGRSTASAGSGRPPSVTPTDRRRRRDADTTVRRPSVPDPVAAPAGTSAGPRRITAPTAGPTASWAAPTGDQSERPRGGGRHAPHRIAPARGVAIDPQEGHRAPDR